MAFKGRELARKDRKEDLRENPGKYRDEHRADLLGVDWPRHRINLLQPLLLVVGGVSPVIVAIGHLKSSSLEPMYVVIGIVGLVCYACLAILEAERQGYFSKALKRLMPRELPASHEAPRLAQMLLLFVSKRNREYIIGDLEEEYRTTNKRFPRLWYWGQVSALVASYWWATLRRLLGFDVVLKMIRK